MIEASEHSVTVLTDHAATIAIVKQTSLSSSSIDKLNNRLTRASQYLAQFHNLNVVYIPGKEHVVPDALSRLTATDSNRVKQDSDVLEDLVMSNSIELCHTTTILEIQPEFKKQLQTAYSTDKHFSRIHALATQSPEETSFRLENELLWNEGRLCIPKALEADVFETAHNNQFHIGFHRLYPRIRDQYYIRKLEKHLRRYLLHCPQCQLLQTKRHRPYGSLQPIYAAAVPFHTITIDFVVGLPMADDCNALLTTTCKFSKRILLIAGHDTLTADAWAHWFLDALLGSDWGLPSVIISDRDSKFMGIW